MGREHKNLDSNSLKRRWLRTAEEKVHRGPGTGDLEGDAERERERRGGERHMIMFASPGSVGL